MKPFAYKVWIDYEEIGVYPTLESAIKSNKNKYPWEFSCWECYEEGAEKYLDFNSAEIQAFVEKQDIDISGLKSEIISSIENQISAHKEFMAKFSGGGCITGCGVPSLSNVPYLLEREVKNRQYKWKI